MEMLYANLHYRLVSYLDIIKNFNSIKDKKSKKQILKNNIFTILFNICFLIVLPSIILIGSEILICVFIMEFLNQLIALIPFDMIRPEWLQSLSMNISRFFVVNTYNKSLTIGSNDLIQDIGSFWLLIGSLLLWRSMLIFSIASKTGSYNSSAYQNGLLALMGRLFVRCCKYSFVIIIWPIFLFSRLPQYKEFINIPRYSH